MKERLGQRSTMEIECPVAESYCQMDQSRKRKRLIDRFIPSRSASQLDLSSHIWQTQHVQHDPYNRLIAQSLSNKRDCDRILSYKESSSSFISTEESIMELLSKRSQSQSQSQFRNVNLVPEKILDAPELRDDYYLNLLDWSACGPLGIGLNNKVYLYTPTQISQLCALDDSYVCSISFHAHNPVVAVGNSLGRIHLYDLEKQTLVRVMRGHFGRVSSLSFSSALFSGSKDTTILAHDTKSPNNVVMRFDGHKGEVCGLKHDACGVASGSNDNTAIIWDINAGRQRTVLTGHKAAVKALAWCPWQRGLLATGGGTTDKTMKFWNTDTGKLINSINTESQVCSLIWNRDEKQILSSHGFSHNQLCIWKYPQNTKMVELHGHTQRVLHMALSPDGSTVCSASADETLRFWKVFDGTSQQNFCKKDGNFLQPGQCSLR